MMQISAALLSEDQRLRLPRFLDDKDDKDPEATKQVEKAWHLAFAAVQCSVIGTLLQYYRRRHRS